MPPGWNHERITADIIRNSEIKEILQSGASPINPEHVVNVCWDVSKRAKVEPEVSLTPWETLLNEIITGNTFGADRIDYLLRDSWHAGVAYGRFDPDRLIAGLRIVVDPQTEEISLGIDRGAIHAAESLLLARYFMYTQVYMHDVRRVYDLHLKDFVKAWLGGTTFPTDWQNHLRITDNELLSAMSDAARNPDSPFHLQAIRILKRRHFRTVYELVSAHKQRRPTILIDLAGLVREEFGDDFVRLDSYGPKTEANSFPVLLPTGSVENSTAVSGVIENIPALEVGLIFVEPSVKDQASAFVRDKIDAFLNPAQKGRRRVKGP